MATRGGLVLCVALACGCPAQNGHIPLPRHGDASATNYDLLPPFFAQQHSITVKVLKSGQPLAGANVLFHDATGKLLSQVATAADGSARAPSAGVSAASVAWSYLIGFGTASDTQYEIMTWTDLPQYKDVLLQIDVGFRPPGPQPTPVRVTLPGAFAGASSYEVDSCETTNSTTTPAQPLTMGGPRCGEMSALPFLALAKQPSAPALAFSTVVAAAGATDVTLQPWRTDFQSVSVTINGLAQRAAATSQLVSSVVMPQPGGAFIAQLDSGPAQAQMTLRSPDLGNLGARLGLVLQGAQTAPGAPSGMLAGQGFRLFDVLPAGATSRAYDVVADVIPSPGVPVLDVSESRRPALTVMSDPAIERADVMCAVIGYRTKGAPTPEGASYDWTACAPATRARTFKIPELEGPAGDLIGATKVNWQFVTALDSDALASYADVLALDTYAAVTYDGRMPLKSRLAYAFSQVGPQ